MNIVKDVLNIEFLNNLDESIFNLLFSKEKGYINLVSKEAVLKYEKYLNDFDIQLEKITKNIDIKKFDKVINDKKDDYKKLLRIHFAKELDFWLDEMFEELIENILFNCEINNEFPDVKSKYYVFAINSINWYCTQKNMNDTSKQNIIDDFINKFNNIPNNKNIISPPIIVKTNPEVFFQIWDVILEDKNKFSALNLDDYNKTLSSQDLNFYKNLQKQISTTKYVQVLDDIFLYDYVCNDLNIKEIPKKYSFLKEILDEISNKNSAKEISDDDKISIIKKRVMLFKAKQNPKFKEEYCRELLA